MPPERPSVQRVALWPHLSVGSFCFPPNLLTCLQPETLWFTLLSAARVVFQNRKYHHVKVSFNTLQWFQLSQQPPRACSASDDLPTVHLHAPWPLNTMFHIKLLTACEHIKLFPAFICFKDFSLFEIHSSAQSTWESPTDPSEASNSVKASLLSKKSWSSPLEPPLYFIFTCYTVWWPRVYASVTPFKLWVARKNFSFICHCIPMPGTS